MLKNYIKHSVLVKGPTAQQGIIFPKLLITLPENEAQKVLDILFIS